MNTFRTWLLTWVVGLVLTSAPTWVQGAGVATLTTPSNSAPGYLVRRLDADSVRVRAEFTQSFPAKGKRTLRSTWQLLDDQGKPVGIHLKGGLERGNDTVGDTHAITVAVANVLTPVVLETEIVPYTRLDPSRLYRFRLVSVSDTTSLPNRDLGQAGTQLPGNSYIHFRNTNEPAFQVVVDPESNAWSQRFRVRTAVADSANAAFSVIPKVTVYRYDSGGGAVDVPIRLRASLVDDLGNGIPLQTSEFLRKVPSVQPYRILSFLPTPKFGPNADTNRAVDPILIKPAVPLDAVQRTYVASVTVEYLDDASEGYVPVQKGVSSANGRLLDFNGDLRFGTFQTTFSAISNDPAAAAAPPASGQVATMLTIPAGNGALPGAGAAYSFGGSPMAVAIDPAGIAYFKGAGTVPVTGPIPDADLAAGLRFTRESLHLGGAGLRAGLLTLQLPPGVGFVTNGVTRQFLGTITATNVPLNASVSPIGPVAFPGGRLTEESKPIDYQTSALEWIVPSGRINATVSTASMPRRIDLDALFAKRAVLQNPESAIKAANDHVYLGVAWVLGGTAEISIDPDNNGSITTRLQLGPGRFHPHFPYADVRQPSQAIVSVSGGIDLNRDRIVAPTSSLTGVVPFEVWYDRACVDQPGATPECGAASDIARVLFTADGGVLRVTRDGGLQGEGGTVDPATAANLTLRWGQDPTNPAKYAHTVISAFPQGSYLMSGSSLVGGIKGTGSTAPDSGTLAELGVGAILFSGVDRAGVAPDRVIRPDTAAYLEIDTDIADYPGINLRAATLGAPRASSRIAAVDTPVYDLTARSQYYLRSAGISGVHEAKAFTESLTLYGYPVKLTSLMLSYLDNRNQKSRTDGFVAVPYPSEFTVEFSELKLTCPGGLDSAEVDSAQPLDLEYWQQAPITPLSLRFETANGCSPAGPAALVLGVRAQCELFANALDGELGFRSNGQIATRADGIAPPFDSRLKMPSVGLPGPSSKTYAFTPSQDVYFNAQNAPGAPASGFLNLAGSVDVPFFKDLKWHVHTRARYTAGLSPTLYAVMSGWTSGSDSFFSNVFFDPAHKGFTGASLDAYRESSQQGGTYAVKAEQDWLGLTQAFHYSLQWNAGGRAFSAKDVTKDFFVFSLTHRAKYLCPDTAELTFGLSYDGLPQINMAGFASQALDAGVGYTQNLIDALGTSGADALLSGIDAGRTLLSNEIEKLISPLLDGPIMTGVDRLLDDLYGLPGTATVTVSSADAAADIAARIRNVGGTVRQSIDSAFANTGVDTATGLADDKLAKVQTGIQQLVGDPNGLLRTQGVKKLVSSLVAREAPQFVSVIAGALAGAAVNDVINSPALDQIRGSLTNVDGIISQVRAKITDPSTGMSAQIQAVLTTELNGICNRVADSVEDELGRYSVSGTIDLPEVPRLQLREYIRQQINDQLIQNQVVAVLETQIRQYAQDVINSVTTELDSGLQQVNTALRDVIATQLAEVDQSINQQVLGPMSDMIGSGRLTGYAHIEGDSLSLLRVDGLFRWKVPEEMDFKAYLQIKQLTSDNSGGCIPPGETANEILIGADDVPLKWISPGLSGNVGVKFTVMGGEPIGLGGFFDMTGGPLTFEAFEIRDMAAAVAFGAIHGDPTAAENYLAANLDLQMGGYGLAGGAFFGRTCTLDPILLIDPEVASVLGTPPFTGAYVYGEARLPVNELIGIPSSCLLQVNIGAGAGAFFFLEGPTFGGKLVGEVSGEALCLVSISGRMSLVGVKEGLNLTSPMRFSGTGTLKGKVGVCPFCVKFKESVGIRFSVSQGQISSPELSY